MRLNKEFLFQKLINLPRRHKQFYIASLDAVFLLTAFWGAIMARLDTLAVFNEAGNWLLILSVIPITIYIFARLGLYRAVLRFMSLKATWVVLVGVAISSGMMIALSFFFGVFLPRTIPVIYFCLAAFLVGGARIAIRASLGVFDSVKKQPIIIYGAGSAGRQLATALHHGHEYTAVAFVDDDQSKQGRILQGVPVSAPENISVIIEARSVKKILLALPSINRSRRREILYNLEAEHAEVLTIPGMADVVGGSARLDEIKEVGLDDLLGREAIEPKDVLMSADITDKVVMVTGAGGSIGAELCRQILQQNPSKLVLFELTEFALYSIEQDLEALACQLNLKTQILPALGSVQNQHRLEKLLGYYHVETVYHAAAYKHVPLVEDSPVEGVRNNVFGTLRAAQAAIASGVDKFVLVSTDKAVRPTNVMGASKRVAELVLQALAEKTDHSTCFTMVRFGNVLGSSGSVVPLFRKQIKEGGPVTLTHPDITRYFMSIPEAAQLVIQAGAMAQGGDVFVLDMGEPVKIKSLAVKMIHLSGYEVKSEERPQGDIEIQCTGLRPGEKLFEELLIGSNVSGTSHERIMTAHEIKLTWKELSALVNKLDQACSDSSADDIRRLLVEAPTGYQPSSD